MKRLLGWTAALVMAGAVFGQNMPQGGAGAEPAPTPPPGAGPGGGEGRGAGGRGGRGGPEGRMAGVFTTQAVILSINLSPLGVPEGIVAKSRFDVAQINFPMEFGEAVGKAVAVGDIVEVTVAPDGGNLQGGPGGAGGGPGAGGPGGGGPGGGGPGGIMPAHPVLRLVALKTADGKLHGMPVPTHPEARVQGTIKALNYDRRGVVNGLQLETGDLVRLPPRAAQEWVVGAQVTAEGAGFAMPNGKLSVQAQRVNGQEVVPGPMNAPPRGRNDLPAMPGQ